MNEKINIKNLLFSKVIPNYVIPVATEGRKLFSCIDCGDKFLFDSSYEYHINRKSVKIMYMCRHCNQVTIFYNRCRLLSHIRSHAFKTATINVSDLKVELLPLSHYSLCKETAVQKEPLSALSLQKDIARETSPRRYKTTTCNECNMDITETGIIYKDRRAHFMKYTNKVYSCPVCLFSLPTLCGLTTHIRIHTKSPPYYCPECGIYLSNKNAHYPYNHDCEGFRMMRATARSKCPIAGCKLLHPSALREHIQEKHLKKVYKCPLCNVACFSKSTMTDHLKGHPTNATAAIFYQCDICTGRLVLKNQIEPHLKSHYNNFVYPCWMCGLTYENVHLLISHYSKKHDNGSNQLALESIMNVTATTGNVDSVYRIIKSCDTCKKSFKYQCKYEQINTLPKKCPFKCTGESNKTRSQSCTNSNIICYLCKEVITQNWEDIKKHFAKHHTQYRCVDVKIVLTRLHPKKCRAVIKKSCTKNNASKKLRKTHCTTQNSYKNSDLIKNNDKYICKCAVQFESKELLEKHLICHRDPCMAYQCMECGQCFVVKPSFSTHLLVEHDITDVDDYISTKQCYNKNALDTYTEPIPEEPLCENQCKICRKQFDDSYSLQKHFRIHGMAFIKSTSNKNSSP